MQHDDPKSQYKHRCRMVGLTVRSLARTAGVDPSTVHRLHQPDHDGYRSTSRKVEETLVAREREVLTHLLALYGKLELLEQIIPPADTQAAA
jgi:DNA-binding MurR/RpiR family transcriptional regulator